MNKYNLRIVLSDKCNYKCVFCSHDFNRLVNIDIDKNFLHSCIIAFANIHDSLRSNKITFTGGEPLVYSGLYDAMRLVKSLGMKSSVTTNGSLLSLQTGEFFELANYINISIPSFEQSEYKKLTGSAFSLDEIKNNAVSASQLGLRVKINMVYTQNNDLMLEEAANFFASHGIIIKLMNDMLAGEEYYMEFTKFASRYENDSRFEIERALNPGLKICSECKIKRDSSCPSCRSLWVYPDGRITLCPFENSKSFADSDYEQIYNHIQEELKS